MHVLLASNKPTPMCHRQEVHEFWSGRYFRWHWAQICVANPAREECGVLVAWKRSSCMVTLYPVTYQVAIIIIYNATFSRIKDYIKSTQFTLMSLLKTSRYCLILL